MNKNGETLEESIVKTFDSHGLDVTRIIVNAGEMKWTIVSKYQE